MRKAVMMFLTLFIISCNDLAGYNDVDKTELVLVRKSTINETELVLSMIPLSYVAAGDSLLACIVDSRSLVLYNIYSGELYKSVRIDSALIQSGFNNATYTKENCLNKYEGREYILSQDSISWLGMPLIEVIKVVPPISSLDSLTILVKVLTPYKKDFMYEGKRTDAIWASISTMLVSFDLNKKNIHAITPVNQSLVEKDNDKNDALAVYLVPDYGSLLYGRYFYTITAPGANKFRSINEVGIFDLHDASKVRFDAYKYPAEYAKYSKRKLMSKTFQIGNDNQIWCNSMYDIYTIDMPGQKKEIISLKSLLDSTRQEYINSFYKKDKEHYLIQTIVGDSSKAFFNFRFFNQRTGAISLGKLLKPRMTTSVDVAYNKNNVIFISKDDEHYYIENYKIVEP